VKITSAVELNLKRVVDYRDNVMKHTADFKMRIIWFSYIC